MEEASALFHYCLPAVMAGIMLSLVLESVSGSEGPGLSVGSASPFLSVAMLRAAVCEGWEGEEE